MGIQKVGQCEHRAFVINSIGLESGIVDEDWSSGYKKGMGGSERMRVSTTTSKTGAR